MRVLESAAARNLTKTFMDGFRLNWLGVAGDSVSRWLTGRELMAVQTELDLNAAFRPLDIEEPRLARECFMFCCHGEILPGGFEGHQKVSLMILQINDKGSAYRVLWENGEPNRPPFELNLHLTAHAAHSVGPGNVVFHCQPLKTIALSSIVGNDEGRFLEELRKGYAAIINMLPDGIGIVPWGMKTPQRRGMNMTEEMVGHMRDFIADVRDHIDHQEAVIFLGEGVLCASHSEQAVFGIINSMERASEIRLLMMSAGVR